MSQSRQLAAIMFTDIVGYTALMGKDDQKAMQAGLLGVGAAVVLFQRSSLDFPYGVLGQAGQEENLFRHLMSGDLLFGKFNQFCLGGRLGPTYTEFLF